MLLTLIFLPLIGAISSGFLGRFIGKQGSCIIPTTLMFFNVVLTFLLAYDIIFLQQICLIKLRPWISSDVFYIDWGFYVDNLTIIMLLVVNIISAFVHLYSTEYMEHDPHLPRFMSYLSLFTFFMLLLITGDNFIILFLGWEGVGLCSYLLIGFWYTRIAANKAAIKAMIVNRIADFTLTIGLIALFNLFYSLDFHVVFPLTPFYIDKTFILFGYDISALFLICSLLFLGAMGKSAQIGLHTWLPDAMEGPTPVSALIHAATMVTAGVFLIIKCSPLFEYVPNILSVITFIGALTAFFAATVGLVQNDIKKVIAYSTCSQLGYMVFACGLSNYHVSLFHLANHAFFKALLFLSAGAIIHSISNEQDMRRFGSLLNILPFSSIMLLIGSLSLMGLPFLTGFYSKDLIIEIALTKYTIIGSFAYTLGLVTAFLTSFYSFRVFYLTFLIKNNSLKKTIEYSHELPLGMAFSLSILSLGAIFLGYFTKDLLIGLGTDFWSHSIHILPENNNQLDAEFYGVIPLQNSIILDPIFRQIPQGTPILATLDEIVALNAPLVKSFFYDNVTFGLYNIKLLPFIFSILAISLVFLLYIDDTPEWGKSSALMHTIPWKLAQSNNIFFKQQLYIKLYNFLISKWYFDSVYNEFINGKILKISYHYIFKLLDKGILELLGPYGISYLIYVTGQKTRKVQTGKMYMYASYMVIVLLLLSVGVSYLI